MSSVAHIPAPLATLDEDAWDDLLNYIEERRVVPIIGPELLKVDTETGPQLLYDWIAVRLAAKLGVDTALLPKPHTLNFAIALHRELGVEVPEADYAQLASVDKCVAYLAARLP